MRYTKFGATGLTVSKICLGMMSYGTPQWRPWILGEEATRPLFRKAIELGVNYFDTADMYSAGESEVITGKLVREFCRREEVVIATKGFHPVNLAFKGGAAAGTKPVQRPNLDGLSRKRLRHAVDASLQRLGVDYIDLYQIHRLDPQTPIEETMEALHEIVKTGKIRYLGASSMPAWKFAKAQHVAQENGWTRFSSMQHHYNLAYREEEREMIPLCRDQGVALVPWSPLARGFLAGTRGSGAGAVSPRQEFDDVRTRYYSRECDLRVRTCVDEVATRKNISNATLACAWLLNKGMTALAVGTTKEFHIEEAAASVELSLSNEEISQLEQPYEPHPVIGY